MKKNIRNILRSFTAVLSLCILCSIDAYSQILSRPGGYKGVYPGEAVEVEVTGVLSTHSYVLVNEDDSDMCRLSVSGATAGARLSLPDGVYRVIDENGGWRSGYFTVETYPEFNYSYPELYSEYAIPPGGGQVRMLLTKRKDALTGQEERIADGDEWYQQYDPLAEWNNGTSHNSGWNTAFSWDVECDEGDGCVVITVTAPANTGGTARSADMGIVGRDGRSVVITQGPSTGGGGSGDTPALTKPVRRYYEVFPGEQVETEIEVSGAVNGHRYVLEREDGGDRLPLEVQDQTASASVRISEGEYHVLDVDSGWRSECITVNLYEEFRYYYDVKRQYVLPPSGGSVTIELYVKWSWDCGDELTIADEEEWYCHYDNLAEWNKGTAHNRNWNSAFTWDVECDDGDGCVRITVSAKGNYGAESRTADTGISYGGGTAIITQSPKHGIVPSDDFASELPQNMNWIAVRSVSSGDSAGSASRAMDVIYYNGLGYPSQEVAASAGGMGDDIVTCRGYDGLQRESTTFLPYAVSQPKPGVYDNNFTGHQAGYYSDLYSDTTPYSETRMEFSVRGRPTGSTIPGDAYASHGSSIDYLTNEGHVVLPGSDGFDANSHMLFPWLGISTDGGIQSRGFRRTGSLVGTKTTDGDGRVSIQWRDAFGNPVAQDRFDGDTLARTLFVYDRRGRLGCVLTPEGYRRYMSALLTYCSDRVESYTGEEDIDYEDESNFYGLVFTLDSTLVDRWCYLYSYDGLGRVISKKIPGREAETFSYDALDRVITSQDGEQRRNGVTIYYEYDGIGRLTGKSAKKNGVSRTLCGYRYDPSTGLKTGETVYALTADGWVDSGRYLTRSFVYDEWERLISSVETESGGGYTLGMDFTYDLADHITHVRESCTRNAETVYTDTWRMYDSRGRLTEERIELNGGLVSTVTTAYDELGRTYRTDYGSGDNAITEWYSYTMQGWQSSRSSILLGQDFRYEDSENPSWTGNITGIDWEHNAVAGETDSNGSPAAYRPIYSLFSYDSMNRLKDSTVDAGMGIDDRRWSEKDIRYDFDGNILHIDRYQDNNDDVDTALVFSYIGPHRTGYGYDANGNVSFDPLRGFDMKYNLLNLPAEVREHQYLEFEPGMNQGIADIFDSTAFVTHPPYGGGSGDGEKDRYIPLPGEDGDFASASEVQLDTIAGTAILRAGGELLSRSVYYADGTRAVVYSEADSTTVRYIGSMVYVSTPDGEETLSGIVTADGYIDCSGGTENSEMQYFLRDHLGSVRVVATDRNTVISRRDYLPSGVQMTGNGLTTDYSQGSSWYGFSGKENERDGSRYLHFGARTYDPVGCIFLQVDPLTEKYYDITPYSYCGGNPIIYFDPDGLEKIVSLRNSKEHPKSENDKIKSFVAGYKDYDYTIQVWAHGEEDGFSTKDGTIIPRNNPKAFAPFMNNESDVWVDNSLSGETSTVVFHSCETGKDENSIAGRISEKFHNVVVAPSEKLYVDAKEKNGKDDQGYWNFFYNGELLYQSKVSPDVFFKYFSDTQQVIDFITTYSNTSKK